MKHTVTILIVTALGGFSAVLFPHLENADGLFPFLTRPARAQTRQDAHEEVIISEHRPMDGYIDPVDRTLRNPDEAGKRYGLAIAAEIKETGPKNSYTRASVMDYRDKIMHIFHDGAPRNAPKLFLNFVRPGPDGRLKPALVDSIRMHPIRAEEGGTFTHARQYSHQTDENYARELHSISLATWSKEYLDMRHLGQRDEYDRDVHGSEFINGGCAAVVLLSGTRQLKYNSLIMGRLYSVAMSIPENDGGEMSFSNAILQIPEHVPPGQVAIMDIDVTQNNVYHEIGREVRRPGVGFTLRIEGEVPEGAFAAISSPGGRVQELRIGKDGAAERRVDALGGELMVGVHGEREAQMLYYRHRVDQEELAFPEDADIVVRPGDMTAFDLRIPTDQVPADSEAILLFIEEDSLMPAAWGRLGSDDIFAPERTELPDTVGMRFIPGTYYVAYMTDTGREIIGHVEIRSEDAGATIPVQPLDE